MGLQSSIKSHMSQQIFPSLTISAFKIRVLTEYGPSNKSQIFKKVNFWVLQILSQFSLNTTEQPLQLLTNIFFVNHPEHYSVSLARVVIV